jgi:hypothetical protein
MTTTTHQTDITADSTVPLMVQPECADIPPSMTMVCPVM